MAKRERTSGLLPPIRTDFKTALKAMLGTPLTDEIKGGRNVNPRTLKRKPARRTAKKRKAASKAR
jgi:hypothetical protein